MDLAMDSLKRQLNMIAECLPPSPFKASVEQVAANAIAELNRLTALCDGYRGERDAAQWSTDVLAEEVKALKSALTRARAEGMQEALRILARNDHWETAYNNIAAAIRERAAKGEQ